MATANKRIGQIIHKLAALIFSRENLIALIFCLIILAILIFTVDRSPQWIYQGF